MSLDFTRRGGVTSNDVIRYPKLLRDAKGEEVLYVMEGKNGLPVDKDSPIANGVTRPSNLIVRVVRSWEWDFVSF